jgi:biotin carboxyl carrier protein
MGQKYTVSVNGENFEIEVSEVDDGVEVTEAGKAPKKVTAHSKLAQSVQQFTIDGNQRVFAHRKSPNGHLLVIDGSVVHATVQDARATKYAAMVRPAVGSHRTSVKAPMPGLVASVLVAAGEEVRKDQTLLTLSAMKLENDIRSPMAGRVVSVNVEPGQAVEKNFPMMVVE